MFEKIKARYIEEETLDLNEEYERCRCDRRLNPKAQNAFITKHAREQLASGEITREQAERKMKAAYDRRLKKLTDEIDSYFKEIEDTPSSSGTITINVDWKKNSTWGYCPSAELRGLGDHVESPTVTGCGFDKLSTAVAKVLNGSPVVLKHFYTYIEDHFSELKKDSLGYGFCVTGKPRFEGGVGVSCYRTVFENIGASFRQVADGKTYDVFEITF